MSFQAKSPNQANCISGGVSLRKVSEKPRQAKANIDEDALRQLAQDLKLTRIQKTMLRQGLFKVVDKSKGAADSVVEPKETPAQVASRQLL